MTRICLLFLMGVLAWTVKAPAASFDSPRVAVVIGRSSFELERGRVKSAALGWTAAAHLAGLPYDCLFLADLGRADLSGYDLLILSQCANVDDGLYAGLSATLAEYLKDGGNLVIEGPLAARDETGSGRDHSRLDTVLGIVQGEKGGQGKRISVASVDHYITSPFEPGAYLTQPTADGIGRLEFRDGGGVLLAGGDGTNGYPFLSWRERDGSRLVLVGDISSGPGAASFFRNRHPQGFFANRLYEVLIRVLHWATYGDIAGPFPVPQVANANLTAIVRLDADGCRSLLATEVTIDYLAELARQTGVLSVYALVSSWAERVGWDKIAPVAAKIEQVGGEVSTHSRTHRTGGEMTPERWEEELAGSKLEIESNMSREGYPIGRVDFFVNPGNSIPMNNYGEIARRFPFFMTHGGEQEAPLAYGAITWFTDPGQSLAVINCTPAPDYQWFYDPGWSYSTAQITSYQEAVFDHMHGSVGRGVIFNQMWHDYGITQVSEVEPPRTEKYRQEGTRIINDSNIAMYDGLKSKFATNDIYCPGPMELTNKLKVMADWNYDWTADGKRVELVLDISSDDLKPLATYTGGMGVRLENSGDYIRSVSINGQPHFAFGDRLVILPDLEPGRNRIEVELGDTQSAAPRLTFISKRMPSAERVGDELRVKTVTKSRANFKFQVEGPFVLLNADAYEWDRRGDSLLAGHVTSDRELVLKETSSLTVVRADLPITGIEETRDTARLKLAGGKNGRDGLIRLRAVRELLAATLDSRPVDILKDRRDYILKLPVFAGAAELEITF